MGIVAVYFIGFFTGGLALAALVALELPFRVGILFIMDCVTFGLSISICLVIADRILER